jgi:acetyl esterase/lipase
LGVETARATLEEVQSSPIDKPDVDIEDRTITGGPHGDVQIRILRPAGAAGRQPVILYIHGAGWVLGSPDTHDRLVRKLAVEVGAAVVFPHYRRAPEAQFPSQIEECYATLEWVARDAATHGLDSSRIAVAGDSVGGNMTAAITLMAKQRSGPGIAAQLLFYPVTDAAMDTSSYEQFAEGFFLRREGMVWFWNQYLPEESRRSDVLASPLRATEEQLAGLPTAMVISGEADVLRDEGEAYANKLRTAGVSVTATRYEGIIHDFVMLHPLAETNASKAAITQAVGFLRDELKS